MGLKMNTTCESVRELLQQRMDGDLRTFGQDDLVTGHLITCAACRSFKRDMERVVGVIEHLPVQHASPAFVSRVMASLPERQKEAPRVSLWLDRLARWWAQEAGLLGLLILIYHAMIAHGVSLLNLPSAVGEWVALVDPSNLSSLVDATSLFGWNLGPEFLIGISLLMIAVCAMIIQVIGKPPAIRMSARRQYNS
jgi:predicted anti-sigma-YlaC factor YlaD